MNSWKPKSSKKEKLTITIKNVKKKRKLLQLIYCLLFFPYNFEEFLQKKYSWTKPFPWRQGNHEPSFSIDIIQQNQLNQKNEKTSHFIDLVKTHGHLLISGEFQNVKSNVLIYCNEHQSEYTTTFGNYRRCKTGLPCCGRAQQVQKAKRYKRNALGIFVKDNDNDNEDK